MSSGLFCFGKSKAWGVVSDAGCGKLFPGSFKALQDQRLSGGVGMNSFDRAETVRALRRVALARGWFGAHDLAQLLDVSKRRALQLLGAGRVPGAVRARNGGEWLIPVQLTGELEITPGRRGPRLRVKDRRPGKRLSRWRV
jgi:hypothetical protein